MPASFTWQPGPGGGTPVNAANLNKLAVTADAGTAGSPTGDALRSALVAKVKDDNGGAHPAPLRAPVLHEEVIWPNQRYPYNLLWVAGLLMYAYGSDKALRKSTDGGLTWVKVGYQATMSYGAYGTFLRLADGTLLNITSSGGATIWRSTDDGATWTSVLVLPTNKIPLGAQSWAVDQITGYVFFGEYNSTYTPEGISLWRSTDGGATWTVFKTWAAAADAAGLSGVHVVKHIHSVQWDSVMGRIVISMGDSSDWTGLWRVNTAGTDCEPVLLNNMLPAPWIDAPRSIGIMPFPDYIAWAGDTTSQPYVFRMARALIGTKTTYTIGDLGSGADVERIPYRLNTSAWFTCRAADDGSRWLITSSEEGTAPAALDRLTHLYAVEDQGATVWEVGAIKGYETAAANSLQPVGRPEMHGETFYMNTRSFLPALSYKFRLGRGFTSLRRPPPLPHTLTQETYSCPTVTLQTGEEVILGRSICPSTSRTLYVYNFGATKTAGTGALKIRARLVSNLSVLAGVDSAVTSYRQNQHLEGGGPVASQAMTSADVIEWVLVNTGGGSATGTGFGTFGWGE